jgi:phosphocarrier protein
MKINHTATGSVLLQHAAGLHARPCVKLTKLAKRFRAHLRVGAAAGGPWTDAKSIARVMAMKTPGNATLFFEAEGEDAQEAVAALVRLVQSDFEEPTHAA